MTEVVAGKLNSVTVENDASLVDAVGVTADCSTEVACIVLGKIIGDAVKAQHHVMELAVTVGDHDRH